MTTYVRGPAFVAKRIKKIKPRLEPGIPSMRDLDGFMKYMIRRLDAVCNVLRSVKSEIAVQFHHRVAFSDGLAAIDLDLIVLLCESRKRACAGEQHGEQHQPHGSLKIKPSFSPRLLEEGYKKI